MLPSYFDWHEGVILNRCGNIRQCGLTNYKLWLSKYLSVDLDMTHPLANVIS
jgi:hypothetical protein